MWKAMTIVSHGDLRHSAEWIVLKIHCDSRCVGIETVPDELGYCGYRLCFRLALKKIWLDFNGVFSH
jgi:hypothetical protein